MIRATSIWWCLSPMNSPPLYVGTLKQVGALLTTVYPDVNFEIYCNDANGNLEAFGLGYDDIRDLYEKDL